MCDNFMTITLSHIPLPTKIIEFRLIDNVEYFSLYFNT